MAVSQTSHATFKTDVLEKKGLVFVDFFADWCGPCKMTAPIIEILSQEHTNITFYKVNVDENNELASQYSIFSIPTFVLFKDGQVVSQFSGAMGKEGFEEELNKVNI